MKGHEDIHPEEASRSQEDQEGASRRKNKRAYKLRAEGKASAVYMSVHERGDLRAERANKDTAPSAGHLSASRQHTKSHDILSKSRLVSYDRQS